ncbi:Mov34/MPN/PAD-1 family protein [Arthrobacter sp. NPDC093128]|uniref:Mov34/MPN/PAD-1 family protein n=1 Tax=Arthrobacter sp. NPDC093128 TaxID=3154979 RepID=UPI0034443A2F
MRTWCRVTFVPDTAWQASELAKIYAERDRRVSYLGDWHTHPTAQPIPSSRHLETLGVIAAYSPARSPEPLMAILGKEALDQVVSGARAGLPGGRLIPVGAGIGLSGERRDAVQFQKGLGPPRAGAGESSRRHGEHGREYPRCLLWHTIGHGALRLGSQTCHCGPGSARPRAATRLVAGLAQMAAVAGARRVILQTGDEQPEAEALYPKIG